MLYIAALQIVTGKTVNTTGDAGWCKSFMCFNVLALPAMAGEAPESVRVHKI